MVSSEATAQGGLLKGIEDYHRRARGLSWLDQNGELLKELDGDGDE